MNKMSYLITALLFASISAAYAEKAPQPADQNAPVQQGKRIMSNNHKKRLENRQRPEMREQVPVESQEETRTHQKIRRPEPPRR